MRELEYGDVECETGGVRFLMYQTDLAGTNEASAASFVVEDFDDVIAAQRSTQNHNSWPARIRDRPDSVHIEKLFDPTKS